MQNNLQLRIREYFSIIPDRVHNDYLLYLQTFTGGSYSERDTLIVFDEVQLFPQARGFIKHLVADGRYDYVETGSLISLKRNVSDILIPSEEEAIVLRFFCFSRRWSVQRRPFPDCAGRISQSMAAKTPIRSARYSTISPANFHVKRRGWFWRSSTKGSEHASTKTLSRAVECVPREQLLQLH
ncbi:AAA family ATPase [Adlercreutzia caecimuris]|uniref:AAA family ATPase n=1 Tax=Adlercreutzia caecimuris TaxID=671266 RepID=UPI0031E5F91D